jgi:hypothetical protein
MRQEAKRAAEGLGMTRDEIIKLFRQVAKEHGYSCRNALAWRQFDKFCGLVELDRTVWRQLSTPWVPETSTAHHWRRFAP